MSEEEIKAVEHLNSFLNIPEFVWIKESELLMINVKIALNLIEKQQKEIEHWKAGMKIVERDKNNHIERLEKELDNIKEIEKTHKEENGKLRVEFEKVYEDNLTLAHELEQYKLLEANIDKANKIIAENKFDEGLYGLLMQEKEKNKDLEEKLKISVAMLTKGTYPEENEGDNDFDKQFIAVDKIKEKIELLKDILKAKEKDGNIYKQIPIEYLKSAIEQLEELLEEK